LGFAKHADLMGSQLRKGAKSTRFEFSPEHQVAVFDWKAYFLLQGGEDMLLKHFNDLKIKYYMFDNLPIIFALRLVYAKSKNKLKNMQKYWFLANHSSLTDKL